MDAAQAHQMLDASRRHSSLVTQVVPSPFGLKGHAVMLELIGSGYVGELREVHVVSMSDSLADPAAPLSWRQDAALSGFNMLTLGIVHETVLRWLPPPTRVAAQVHAFIPSRIDPQSGVRRTVGTPDSVQVLAVLADGTRATYMFSGVTPFGQRFGIWLYGSDGILQYDLAADRIFGASRRTGRSSCRAGELEEIPIPPEKAMSWRVEAEFVDAIREKKPVQFTNFETAVSYMEFTEAVARSAQRDEVVELPLPEFTA
jgi:predicted dehydrogenase